MVCRWTPSDVTRLSRDWPYKAGVFPNSGWKRKEMSTRFSVVYNFVSRLQIKTTEGQLGGPLWLRIMHCDWSSDLMMSKQTKNWKPGGHLFPFSTVIWKNASLIWLISAQLCDVIGVPTHIIIQPPQSPRFLRACLVHYSYHLYLIFHLLFNPIYFGL